MQQELSSGNKVLNPLGVTTYSDSYIQSLIRKVTGRTHTGWNSANTKWSTWYHIRRNQAATLKEHSFFFTRQYHSGSHLENHPCKNLVIENRKRKRGWSILKVHLNTRKWIPMSDPIFVRALLLTLPFLSRIADWSAIALMSMPNGRNVQDNV